jgi:hypothetical protein
MPARSAGRGVTAARRRVLELERGLFEWHRVVQGDGRGETPRCRGCGASPIFTGADPCSLPVHAPDCWVAALLAAPTAPDPRAGDGG